MCQPKRHELKYVITKLEYEVLKRKLDKVMKRDINCIEKTYSITSLYFDNCYNQAYHQKINGDMLRHKYRIRFYNEDYSNIKLEKKSKINQMTIKASEPLLKEEVEKIYDGDYEFLLKKEGQLYQDFYKELAHNLSRPKVIVRYEREAFVHSIGDLRITFDSNVKTANKNTNIFDKEARYYSVLAPDEVILEIKFNGIIPTVVSNIIQTGHIMQTASSKYVVSRKYNYEF